MKFGFIPLVPLCHRSFFEFIIALRRKDDPDYVKNIFVKGIEVRLFKEVDRNNAPKLLSKENFLEAWVCYKHYKQPIVEPSSNDTIFLQSHQILRPVIKFQPFAHPSLSKEVNAAKNRCQTAKPPDVRGFNFANNMENHILVIELHPSFNPTGLAPTQTTVSSGQETFLVSREVDAFDYIRLSSH